MWPKNFLLLRKTFKLRERGLVCDIVRENLRVNGRHATAAAAELTAKAAAMAAVGAGSGNISATVILL